MPEILTITTSDWDLMAWTKDIEAPSQRLSDTLSARGKLPCTSAIRFSPPLNGSVTAPIPVSSLPNEVVIPRPVFFENRLYEFDFRLKGKLPAPRIEHWRSDVQDAFHLAGDSLRGLVNFGNDVGWFRLAISWGPESARSRQYLSFEVMPTKMDMDADFGRIASEIDDVYPLWRFAFARKTEQELAASRKATWIAERGYERLLRSAKPGVREYELAADIYTYMKGIGAEDNFLLMSASQHNLAVRAAGGRVLEEGDIILAEITPCYQGQFAQICRTAVIGEASPTLRDKYALLQAAMRAGMDAARPGVPVAQATLAMNDVLTKAGYGDYCKPPHMRVRGHGLGITSSQPGDLHDESQTLFEEGMVFVMHPNQYIPETGYLMCGEPVVISHNGAISLSDRDAELDFVAA